MPQRSFATSFWQGITVLWLVAVAGAVCAGPTAAQEAPSGEALPPEAASPGVSIEQLPPELDQTLAYTTADPVRPDVLGLATLDGRYAFEPSAGCSSSAWSIADGREVMLSIVAGQGAWIAPLASDRHVGKVACPIQILARMSSVPCLVNTRGVCDVSNESGTQ